MTVTEASNELNFHYTFGAKRRRLEPTDKTKKLPSSMVDVDLFLNRGKRDEEDVLRKNIINMTRPGDNERMDFSFVSLEYE